MATCGIALWLSCSALHASAGSGRQLGKSCLPLALHSTLIGQHCTTATMLSFYCSCFWWNKHLEWIVLQSLCLVWKCVTQLLSFIQRISFPNTPTKPMASTLQGNHFSFTQKWHSNKAKVVLRHRQVYSSQHVFTHNLNIITVQDVIDMNLYNELDAKRQNHC